jgi:hypothetical protein
LLPCCIVINFFLNNQQDAPIIKIFSVIKPHVLGIFSAHHQEFSTAHSAPVSFMRVFDYCFQVDSGWKSMDFHPESAWKQSSKTCMKLTSAECTVENS